MRSVATLAGLSLWALGCAHATTIEKVDVDTYHITCKEASLVRCLGANVNNVCDGRAYFVRGVSEVNRRGHTETPDVATSSEAVVRCANGDNWGEMSKELVSAPPPGSATPPATLPSPAPTPAAPAASVAPPKTEPVCKPGSTQSCVGAAACAGGQACKADGSGYEPCDCGAAQAPVAPQ